MPTDDISSQRKKKNLLYSSLSYGEVLHLIVYQVELRLTYCSFLAAWAENILNRKDFLIFWEIIHLVCLIWNN